MAGLVASAGPGFVSGFTATLIAVLAGALSVVFTASFGAVPRPSLVTFLDEATALAVPIGLDFRVSFPFIRLKDIIPSDPGESFLIPVPTDIQTLKLVNGESGFGEHCCREPTRGIISEPFQNANNDFLNVVRFRRRRYR